MDCKFSIFSPFISFHLGEINYRDAVFAIGTRVVGLKLAINEAEIDEERIPVYDWYCQVFARDDRDDSDKKEGTPI